MLNQMKIPAGPQEVTPEWLTEALRSTGTLADERVTGVDVKDVGEGAGFIGIVSRVTLQYDRPSPDAPASLIAKFPAASPGGREIGNLVRFYEREIRFYEEIAGEVDLRTPRRYYSAMDIAAGEYILLLEDLSPGRCGDQLGGCTASEAELALRSLADFHAAWWESPRLEQIGEWMPVVDAPVHRSAEKSYAQAWAPFMENFGQELSATMRATAERIGENVVPLLSSYAPAPRTIIHGDYRLDNMFFGCAGEESFAVADWQISSIGRGIFDVSYFVAGGMDPAERRANERELLRLYYDRLLQRGVKDYPWELCWEDYRRGANYVLIYVVISLGTLDFANERGLALFRAWLERATSAIEDLDAAKLLPV
jgi:hypothetical protein